MRHLDNPCRKHFYLGIFEYWDYDSAQGLEILPVGICRFEGSLFAYEKYKVEKDWEYCNFDLLYFGLCATIIAVGLEKFGSLFTKR